MTEGMQETEGCCAVTCERKRLRDRWHCEVHAPAAYAAYCRYKDYEARLELSLGWKNGKRLMGQLQEMTMQQLIRTYVAIGRAYGMRREYRLRFFAREHWDRAHDKFMEYIQWCMIQCENVIGQMCVSTEEGETEQEEEQEQAVDSEEWWSELSESPPCRKLLRRIARANRQMMEEQVWSGEVESLYRERVLTVGMMKQYIEGFMGMYDLGELPQRYAIMVISLQCINEYRNMLDRYRREHASRENSMKIIYDRANPIHTMFKNLREGSSEHVCKMLERCLHGCHFEGLVTRVRDFIVGYRDSPQSRRSRMMRLDSFPGSKYANVAELLAASYCICIKSTCRHIDNVACFTLSIGPMAYEEDVVLDMGCIKLDPGSSRVACRTGFISYYLQNTGSLW
jgi:hypothetical protein